MNSKITIRKNNSRVFFFSAAICFFFGASVAYGQFDKNPMPVISDDDYEMVVEKFVKIPDDDGKRPRTNCFTFFQDRIFASVELGGKIYEIFDNGDGTHRAELFFDVKAAIPLNTGRQLSVLTNSFHSGLRSVAFHPDFLNNGKFYTSLMEERPADTAGHHYLSDVSAPINADGVVVEWTYDFNADTVDVNSYRELFRVGIPQYDHPMKQIAFNPYAQSGDEDYGLLYIGHGDGNRYNTPDLGGQSNDARGKILRIDPLETDTTPYSIPATNPFVDDPAWLDEIYATGFRNPHSLCFGKDGEGNIHLIVSNAGRDNIEEIQVVNKGENYGWSLREGTYVHLQQGGLNTGIDELPDNEADLGFSYPSAQWSRADPLLTGYGGLSIVGGYLYTIKQTGEKIYLSADFPESGTVMYNNLDQLLGAVTKLDPDNPDRDQPEELTQAPFKILHIYFDQDGDTLTPPVAKNNMLDVIDDDPDYDGSDRSDLRFGRDKDENIYISGKRNGWIYKIQSITSPSGPVTTIDNISINSDIKIFPNPASVNSIINLTFATPLADLSVISLVSSDGREILRKVIPVGESAYEIKLNTLKLQAGFYMLHFQSGQHNSISPVLLQ